MSSDPVFEEVKRYLPTYLSADSLNELYDELGRFPDNMDARLYTRALHTSRDTYQGDGIRDLLVVNLPEPRISPAPAIIVSNTCDVSRENPRLSPINVLYAPIIRLAKYEEGLLARFSPNRVRDHISDIRKQRITNTFYLPQGGDMDYEGLARLDMIQHSRASQIWEKSYPDDRLFTLGDYGFYIFLFKLSIHFTRIQERVPRG